MQTVLQKLENSFIATFRNTEAIKTVAILNDGGNPSTKGKLLQSHVTEKFLTFLVADPYLGIGERQRAVSGNTSHHSDIGAGPPLVYTQLISR